MINAAYQSLRITENEWKNDWQIPPHLKCGSLVAYKDQYGKSNELRDSYGLLTHSEFKLSDIGQIRKMVREDIKIVVKGVMCKEDALAAVENGADGIWISNGANLKTEGSPSTIDVLKSISSVIKPGVEIFIDSGARKGTDVMKCLAFGATAVFINRPIMWGLNFNGYEGCKEVACILNEELRLAMALTSCFKISDITEK